MNYTKISYVYRMKEGYEYSKNSSYPEIEIHSTPTERRNWEENASKTKIVKLMLKKKVLFFLQKTKVLTMGSVRAGNNEWFLSEHNQI